MIPYATDTMKMPTTRNDQQYITVSSPSTSLSQIHSTDESITAGESL